MGFSADFDFHVGLSKPFQTEIERLWLLGWRCSNTDKKYVNFCQLVTSFPGYKRYLNGRDDLIFWNTSALGRLAPRILCDENGVPQLVRCESVNDGSSLTLCVAASAFWILLGKGWHWPTNHWQLSF